MTPETESALESVLITSGNVDTFIDTFFAFLSQRTDFFIECPPEGGPYGFPKGHAEGIIRCKFIKWLEHTKFRGAAAGNNSSSSSKDLKSDHMPSGKASTSLVPQENKDVKQKRDRGTESSKSSSQAAAASSEDCHNGRVTENYAWSQTINEVDVKIPVSPEIKKGKQVMVSIQSNSLKVSIAGVPDPLVDGKLTFTVKKDDSYWNLVPGEAIRIWLQKSQERWWQGLLESEEPLDVSKIEAVRPMEDLGEEEQMKLQEICWNEERKRQGLPTSEDMKMQKVLQEAWDADGSPFKGKPFDPSLIQIGNQGNFAPRGSTGLPPAPI